MHDEPLALEAELLKVLGHPARLRVLQILAVQETCVCDLLPTLAIEQSNLSQHLKLLRKHGVVAFRKEGNRVIYRLANDRIIPLVEAAQQAVHAHLAQMASMASARER